MMGMDACVTLDARTANSLDIEFYTVPVIVLRIIQGRHEAKTTVTAIPEESMLSLIKQIKTFDEDLREITSQGDHTERGMEVSDASVNDLKTKCRSLLNWFLSEDH